MSLPFWLDQKFIYFLCHSQTFCATPKDDSYSASTKCFEKTINAIKWLDWLKKFGLAQKFLGLVEG
jgi:hypothetical protein